MVAYGLPHNRPVAAVRGALRAGDPRRFGKSPSLGRCEVKRLAGNGASSSRRLWPMTSHHNANDLSIYPDIQRSRET